jgi:2-keto-4-pentenoate hydratase/2-oxohepta-3-ene-1,7-dioic acid hydratase in catechol pathway
MKFITFEIPTPVGTVRRLGALLGSAGEERAADLAPAFAARLQAGGEEPRYREYADFRIPQDICEFAAGGEPSLDAAREALAYAEAEGPDAQGPGGERLSHPLSGIRLLAPVPRPVGFRDCLTFEGHKQAGARRRNTTVDPLWYEMPTAYKGNRLTIIGPGDLAWPRYTEKLDYELEIAILIGKRGKDIPEAEGLGHIFGFTVMNDFSARDIQMQEMSLWLGPHKGKDFGTAIGPCIVTRDEFDHTDAVMTARINGEEWSRGNAGDMHFSWGRVLEHLSMEEELQPGELIGSGTVGTGCGADLDRWIQPGDVIELEIEGIGVLENRIVRKG